MALKYIENARTTASASPVGISALADGLDLGQKRRRALVCEHLADQRAELAHVFTQEGVGGGEVDFAVEREEGGCGGVHPHTLHNPGWDVRAACASSPRCGKIAIL